MNDPRFKISPDRLEHLAFTTPKATVEFTPGAAYLSGLPVPFWAELERHELVGKVVRDKTVDFDLLYLVGTGGFMGLGTGLYLQYDSTFPGPAFFERSEFEVVKMEVAR